MTRADGWKFLPQQCVLLQLTASAALLVFRCDLAICCGKRPKKWSQQTTEGISHMKLSVFSIMTISPKKPLSAFRIISITLDFPFNSRECLTTCVKFDLRRICLQALPSKFSVCLFPDNVCIQQVSLCPFGCHTYQILLLSTKWFYPVAFKQSNQWLHVSRVSFCKSCFMKISMLRIGSVQIYQQVPRLLKKILRSSATIKIIPRIILANCSYFNAKDFGTPSVPCPSVFFMADQLEPHQKGFGSPILA